MAKGKINSEMSVLGIVAIVAVLAIVFMYVGPNDIIGLAKGGGTSVKMCNDSDGGLNYYVYGYVSGSMPKRFAPYDSCSSATVLRETYCGSNNMGTAAQYTCPYGCANGVCNQAPSQPYCGNGIIESGEDCDGANLNGQTCTSRGFLGGTLACTSACKFDTSGCSVCNNNGLCQPGMGETAANCPGDCVVSPSGTAVYINPGAVEINSGDTITLDIKASSMTNLFGYQFDIIYNPGVLEFYGLQDGAMLSNNGQYSTYCLNYTLSSGAIRNIVCTRIGSSGISGSGLLKRVSFRAIASGTSDVLLSSVKLANPSSASISSTVLNGKVFVN